MKKTKLLLTLAAAVLFVAAVPLSASALHITEIRIDQPSTDDDEYFEITGEAGTSLDGVSYVVLGDGTVASGVVEEVTDLTGLVIPADGFLLVAEDEDTCGAMADLITTLDFENGDNVTHMLVVNFTGAAGDDLDADDDCVLDYEPWDSQLDCVALVEDDPSMPPVGDCWYCDTTVGPDGTNVPGHIFLCDADWYIGEFDICAVTETPGAPNLDACVIDTEGVDWSTLKSMYR